MDLYNSYLAPVCNQALLVFVVAVVAIVKSLLNRQYMKAVALLIASVIAVMVLNCLCSASCGNLAWVYAIIQSLALLSEIGLINLN